jgi:hypothetical protein
VQCQTCFRWLTHHLLLTKLREAFGFEAVLKCPLCQRETKVILLA